MNATSAPVTAVEATLARRRRWYMPLTLIAILLGVAGALLLLWAVFAGLRYLSPREQTPRYADIVEHFKYGSIGSEIANGVPYWVWQALPRAFPEAFGGRTDYAAFGFLYESGTDGQPRDLPIGISRRTYRGVDLVWLNCAVCHVGTWREDPSGRRHIVAGMPSNNLDLGRFVRFLLLDAAGDERMAPANLIEKAEQAGAQFGIVERLLWQYYIGPTVREGLIARSSRLKPILQEQITGVQSPWGPGRVDTFNPYKLVQLGVPNADLSQAERVGTADFPSIFLQHPREGMHLHWDGNNRSLKERNLSAAIGAGVTPETVDHAAIERVAEWLRDLRPPPSPMKPDPAAVERGRLLYMGTPADGRPEHGAEPACAACHGYQSPAGYSFQGARLGQVEALTAIQTDPGRLDSYTERFRTLQLREIFKGTEHQFRFFEKTNGYANMPLDGLWLRAPYLHNGSVPTLHDLLQPPHRRPTDFVRGVDVIDPANGGFLAPRCGEADQRSDPATPLPQGFCFDTRQRGNGNAGHLYGTHLTDQQKADLLAYLRTF